MMFIEITATVQEVYRRKPGFSPLRLKITEEMRFRIYTRTVSGIY